MVVAGSFGAYLGLQPATHLAPAPKWLTVALLLLLALCADAVLWAPPAPTLASLWCFLHPPLPLHFGGGRLTFPLPTIEHPFCVPLLASAAALDCAGGRGGWAAATASEARRGQRVADTRCSSTTS